MDFLYLQSSSLWCLTLTDTTGGKAERPGAGGGLGHVTAFATIGLVCLIEFGLVIPQTNKQIK